MGQDGETSRNKQKAVAEGKGSLAINAASYANVTVYQYVTYESGRASKRETTDPSVCPYPGLETFHTSDAKYFAGRKEDIALLETTLENYNICGVIAASGAGKSSLVHAGLIPALAMRETEAWDVFAFKPGQDPLYSLARSMSGVLAQGDNLDTQLNEIRRNVDNLRETSGRLSEYIEEIIRRRIGNTSGKIHRVLIFIDQWEELYTRESVEDRNILVRELMDVVERGLAKVLLTMRIDFMEEMLLLSTDFFRSLKPGIHYVEPMDEIGLRSAIEAPARKVGLCIPEILTSRLIADLGKGRDYGSLPYLQFVLRQLWEMRNQATNSLTIEAYDGMKGLKGAIGAHADAVFGTLTNEEKDLAQRVLPHLANVSVAGIVTSRRMPFADFDEPARKLLRKLAEPERRLIVLSSATVEVAEAEIVAEVAHEALLDDWKMLSGWIADRKDFFRLRNKLEADATLWIKNERRHDFLIPAGKPLLDAQDLLAKALDGEIGQVLRNFVESSVISEQNRQIKEEIELQNTLKREQALRYEAEKSKYTAQRWSIVANGGLTTVIIGLLSIIFWPEIDNIRFKMLVMNPYKSNNIDPYILSADMESQLEPGVAFRECKKLCPEMVVIPPGQFAMGSVVSHTILDDQNMPMANPDGREYPQRLVKITQPFAVGRFEITWDEWDNCVRLRGCEAETTAKLGWASGSHPVFNVTWKQAKEYVGWMKQITGKKYRLLSEAEWEYVARGNTVANTNTQRYYWGDEEARNYANYGTDECCEGKREGNDKWYYAAPVGSFLPNAFGIYDLAGNVWEFVEDPWHVSYEGAPPSDGSPWLNDGDEKNRVVRGGSWDNYLFNLRSANRGAVLSEYRYITFGFRIARDIASD